MNIQLKEQSNYRHAMSFVVQGYDSALGKWIDSKHGGDSPDQAARNFPQDAAMPGTKLRIVRSKD